MILPSTIRKVDSLVADDGVTQQVVGGGTVIAG